MNTPSQLLLNSIRAGSSDFSCGAREVQLSDTQQWILRFEEAGCSLVDHVAVVLRLDGPLDRPALRAALDTITARHEIMRSVLRRRPNGTVRAIRPADCGFALLCQEVCDEAHVELIRRQELSERFDLIAGPTVRGRLLRLSDQRHVLLVTLHRFVFDRWSAGVVLRELASVYGTLTNQSSNQLTPLKLQCADYARLEDSSASVLTLRRHLDFWKNALLSAREKMALPADRSSAVQCDVTARLQVSLGPEFTAQLQQIARKENVTLLATVLSSWALLLGRWTAQEQVVVGAWLPKRPRADERSLVGPFENIAALPIQLDPDATVHKLFQQVNFILQAAQENSDVSIEHVLDRLRSVHAHSMAVQVMLRLDDDPIYDTLVADLNSCGLCASDVGVDYGRVRAALLLSLSLHRGVLCGALGYAGQLFDRETIEGLAASWKVLVGGIIADVHQTIGRVPLVGSTSVPYEREDSIVACLQDRLVHELVEEIAESAPEDIAVIHEGQQLSYGELNERANQLAHYLCEQDVMTNDLVAVCLEPGIELIVSLLAALKVGSAYVLLDLKDGPFWIESVLKNSSPKILLTDHGLQRRLPHTAVRVIAHDSEATTISSEPTVNLDARQLSPRSLAYVTYKTDPTHGIVGVMIEHRNVSRCLTAFDECFHFNRTDGWLSMHSIARDCATLLQLWGPLAYGSRLIIASAEVTRSPCMLRALVEREQVTATAMSTDEFRLVLPQMLGNRQRSLHAVVLVAEDIRHPVSFEAARALTVQGWPNIIHMCGMPETSFTAYQQTRQRIVSDLTTCDTSSSTLSHAHMYVLDKHCERAPLGAIGEIYVGGAGVARGYLARPDLNAERFRADPFSSDPRALMYKTRKLGRWRHDGSLEWLL